MTQLKPKYHRVLFVPDIHCPYQDDNAVNALMSFAKWYHPETVFYLGDAVDFYAVSRFVKDPARLNKLQEEIDKTVEVLERINKSANGSKKFFIRGN